ncbi:hypothetical protein V8C34DRAFT_291115 [Trichoderma compactum]
MHSAVTVMSYVRLCRQGAPTNDLSTTDRFSLADRAMFGGGAKTTPVPLPVQATSLVSPPPVVLQPVPSPLLIPPTPVQPLEPPMTDVLRYLHRSLSPSQQVPARLDVLALSKYKQVRNLPGLWWEHHHNKTLDPLQYASILAYLVGKAEEMGDAHRVSISVCCYRTKNECEWANEYQDQDLEGRVEESGGRAR